MVAGCSAVGVHEESTSAAIPQQRRRNIGGMVSGSRLRRDDCELMPGPTKHDVTEPFRGLAYMPGMHYDFGDGRGHNVVAEKNFKPNPV